MRGNNQTRFNNQPEGIYTVGPRNANIDALKALSMVMVIVLHATQYGTENAEIVPWSIPYWIVTVSRSFSIVAVNVFVLISGYYCCEKQISSKKLLNLWLTVEVFSVGLYLLIASIPNGTTFSVKEAIKMALPVFTHQYWFFTYYLLLMIISPILNSFVSGLTEKQFRKDLILLLLVFSVAPSINIFGFGFGVNEGYGIVWFVMLYLIAAYFRKNPVVFKWGWLYLTTIALLLLIRVICTMLPKLRVISKLLFQYNSVLVLVASVSLFCFAIHSQHSWNKIFESFIKKVASVSFGVYLLHEHGSFRNVLWHEIVRLEDVTSNSFLFAAKLFLTIIMIYVVGCLLNNIVQKLLLFMPFNKVLQSRNP